MPTEQQQRTGFVSIESSIAIADEDISTKSTSKPIDCDQEITTKDDKKPYDAFIDFLLDESLSSIPIFMKYFAIHECAVLFCGGLYYLQSDLGVLCLSIIPGLSIISIFLHFLLTQFKKSTKIQQTFHSIKHYLVAISIFIIGLLCIYFIYHTNTYLSTLVPLKINPDETTSTQEFIKEILQFPHLHSTKPADDGAKVRPFNYRISFVGSIIAPIIEESFKYLLLALTFPVPFIWSFCTKNKKSSYSDYCIQSLFIMFIALCGGCGIAIMENIGYLAACHWESTREFCLPNRNFDILGAGLARGIFSVPFHCVTACIMADILCMWMNTNITFFNKNRCLLMTKFILSYPISIIIPVFLHSSFNYWMKGIPFMTGLVTIGGFSFLASRIAKKHSFINENIGEQDVEELKKWDNNNNDIEMEQTEESEIDLTKCEFEPFVPLYLL